MACPFAKLATMLGPQLTANAAAAGAGKVADFHHHHHHHHHHQAATSSFDASSLHTATTTLGEALRLGTASSHRAVERSLGVSLLLSSSTTATAGSSSSVHFSRLDYVRFQIMLLCIYSCLEASLVRSAAHLSPLFEGGLMESLKRSGVLYDDVCAHLEVVEQHSGVGLCDIAAGGMDEDDAEVGGEREELWQLVSDSATTITREHLALLTRDQTTATLHYVYRLTHATPTHLIAHAYTRYLGDLSGGQHIVRRVSKRFPCSSHHPQTGFAFYHFDNPKQLKTSFKAALEKCKVEDRQEVVREANRAFELNTGVFESLLPAELRQVHEEAKEVEEVRVEEEKERKHSGWKAESLLVAALVAVSLVYLLNVVTSSRRGVDA